MMTETTRWRLFVSVAMGWSLLIVVLYAFLLINEPPGNLRQLYTKAQAFFLWQGIGFALVTVGTSLIRPKLVGRIAIAYLVISTGVLLGFSRELSMPLVWLSFTLFGLLAINTTHLALKNFLKPSQVSWGLSAGILYSALIPVSFFLGLLDLMTPVVAALLVGAYAMPGLVDLVRQRRQRWKSFLEGLDAVNPVGAFCLGILWISLALAFVWATTPESESDSIRSYLPHIQQMVRDQGFSVQYLDFGRLYVKGITALHAFGFVLSAIDGAKWLSWFSVVALALLLTEEVSRRSEQRNLGLFASAVIITCPILLFLSKSLFHDHLIVLLCVTAFLSLFHALEKDYRRGVLLSAFVMGCAVQTKYNVLIFGLVWALAVLIHAIKKKGLGPGLKWCILPLVTLTVSASPWFIYTFVTTGNPLFPTLENLFPLVPALAERFSPMGFGAAGNIGKFSFGDTLWDYLTIPWTITFGTSRPSDHANGSMGFQLLAFLPFVVAFFLLRENRWRNGLGLGLASLTGFVGICLTTAYPRYWLPIYPLMLIPLILMLGQSVKRTGWHLSRYTTPLAGLTIFAALLLTVPFWTSIRGGLPWQVYTNEVSETDWLSKRFSGYQAIDQLNRVLEPSDRVVSTQYKAIYTIDADAYELPPWRARYYGINDSESLDRYLRDNDIRYWIVNYADWNIPFFDQLMGASIQYRTDERLVAAHSSVVVYDVSPETTRNGLTPPDSLIVEPVLLPPSTSRTLNFEGTGWTDWFPNAQARAARLVAEGIEVSSQGGLVYNFSPPATAHLSRLQILLSSDGVGAILTLIWLDNDKKKIETIQTGANAHESPIETLFFSSIPEQARYGQLYVRPYKASLLHVGPLKMNFFKGARP